MGAWGCTLPSTAAARRTHRSPERKKIRPLTGTPRVLSWRWEVAMILVYRLAGILRIRRNNGFELQSLEWRCPAADDQYWCWGTTNAIACRLGNAGQLPGVLYVRAACRPGAIAFPRSVHSQLQQRRVWAGCCRNQREAASPRGQRPRGNAGGGSQRGQTRGQRRTRETPAKTRGLRLFPVGYLHYPQTEPPCLLYTAGRAASAGECK